MNLIGLQSLTPEWLQYRHKGRVVLSNGRVNSAETLFDAKFPGEAATWPIAPSVVYDLTTLKIMLEIHRVERGSSGEGIAVSLSNVRLSEVGTSEYGNCSWWWTKWEAEAVLSHPNEWSLRAFKASTSNDHAHCLWDWNTLMDGDTAWFHPTHGWITAQYYDMFVRDDVLSWRKAKHHFGRPE